MGEAMVQGGPLLLARRTYGGSYFFWAMQKDNPFTEALNSVQKYVASRTLDEPLPWSRSPGSPIRTPAGAVGCGHRAVSRHLAAVDLLALKAGASTRAEDTLDWDDPRSSQRMASRRSFRRAERERRCRPPPLRLLGRAGARRHRARDRADSRVFHKSRGSRLARCSCRVRLVNGTQCRP
jgi:hypothetical protein